MPEVVEDSSEDIVCCICLAEPREKNPLFLISCGCKGAWFHTECENNWIDWGGNPLLCPVCRRIRLVKKYYGFHWSIGEIQHYYCRCILMSGIEFFFYTYESLTGVQHAIAVPAITLLFLLLPFIFRTQKPYSYYIANTHLHNFYSIFSYAAANVLVKTKNLSKYEYPLLMNITIIMSSIHLVYIMMDFLITCAMREKAPDCFHEFIISRDIVHVNILRITESAPDSRESDEGGGSLVTAETIVRDIRIARHAREGRRNHRR